MSDRGRVQYRIDLTAEAWQALIQHGYDPRAPRRGIGGPPKVMTFSVWALDGQRVAVPMRNRVCELDGIEVDGHESSDLDPGSTACIHCDYEGPNP